MMPRRFNHIIVFALLFVLGTCVSLLPAADAEETTSTMSEENADEEFPLTSPLFDVGRLWLRATSRQLRRLSDSFFLVPDLTSPLTWVFGVVLLVVLYHVRRFLFVPIDRVKLLGDVGYIADAPLTMRDMVELVKRRRAVGDVPPVYPNGWFALLESRSLHVAEVKNISCLGKQLAVFRGEDGRAHAIDAYCPHMGANLAAGGIVKGSCLECPFHGWQFRGDDGKCTHIPYCERKAIPDMAKVQSYSTLERNGFVFLWHHAEGLDPQWEPPIIDEIADGRWTYRGRSEHHINAHIEEVPENGADVAHLSQVHGPIMTAGVDLRYTYSKLWSFARHHWEGQWNQDEQDKHVGVLDLLHQIWFFGRHVPVLDLKVCARQIGPGIVHLAFNSPMFGRGAFIQVLTPVEPLTLRMVHHVYANNFLPTFVAKFFLYAESLMVERDIMIWNNKRYVSKPVFVKSKEDALVQKHRRWYSQFYTEHSPRIDLAQSTTAARAPSGTPDTTTTTDW